MDRLLKSLAFLSLLLGAVPGAAASKAASGCGYSAPPLKVGQFSGNLTVTTQDGDRRYRVYVPGSYRQSQETPVILSFHGAGGTIEKQRKLDGLTEPWRNNRYIVVYLQGLVPTGPDSPGRTAWQVDPTATADDLAYTNAVLDAVQGMLCVAKGNVYAVGKSQGGGMVNLLACDAGLSGRIAAFAPVSGAYYIKNSSRDRCVPTDQVKITKCKPSRTNLPMIAFHGGADPTIPYAGEFRSKTSSCLPAIPHWIAEWVNRLGLDPGSARTKQIKGSDGGNRTTWGDAPGQIRFVYDGNNIPHDWPSTVPNSDNGGQNLAAFNATEYILTFIDGKSL